MKIHIATDHAGYDLKEQLKPFIASLGHEAVDHGAFEKNSDDDYPDFITSAAQAVAGDTASFGIIIGGSGQAEAMCANRIAGVRAAVYYGGTSVQVDNDGVSMDMIHSVREHNNANILSLGARFMSEDEAKEAVKVFLETEFSRDPRHVRRLGKF